MVKFDINGYVTDLFKFNNNLIYIYIHITYIYICLIFNIRFGIIDNCSIVHQTRQFFDNIQKLHILKKNRYKTINYDYSVQKL